MQSQAEQCQTSRFRQLQLYNMLANMWLLYSEMTMPCIAVGILRGCLDELWLAGNAAINADAVCALSG